MAFLDWLKNVGAAIGGKGYPVVCKDNNSNAQFLEVDKYNRLKAVSILDDSSNLDAFGRLRVSNNASLFSIQNQYNTSHLFWDEISSGTYSVTHLPNEASVELKVGTANGDRICRQTHQYFRYQPGRSQLILMTGVFGVGKTNVIRRIGVFDDENGLFFEQENDIIAVVIRTKTSGSVNNIPVKQLDWNLDTLDGNGPSGITLAIDKAQIFIIDFQWLGVGRVRFGFVFDGKIIYCHEADHSNAYSTVYMTTANLPIRYEILNVGATASNSTLKQICTLVSSEGGHNHLKQPGLTFACSTGKTVISVTGFRPILSIRPKLIFNGITNRGIVVLVNINIIVSRDAHYRIMLNGTLNSPIWEDVHADSIVEFDINSTIITGGLPIRTSHLERRSSINFSGDLTTKQVLSVNAQATASDIVTIVAEKTTANFTVGASFMWKELY